MSAKDPAKRYDTPTQSMRFALDMHARSTIHTSIPAFVKEYSADTKRARLQPAIRRANYDTGSTFDRAQLLDVPVISQSTGGVMAHAPIVKDDLMLVVFSERGLSKFKSTSLTAISDPDRGRFFDQMDAVAIKWGVQTIKPVDEEAYCIQSADGGTYFKLKDGLIELRCGDKVLRMTPTRGTLT